MLELSMSHLILDPSYIYMTTGNKYHKSGVEEMYFQMKIWAFLTPTDAIITNNFIRSTILISWILRIKMKRWMFLIIPYTLWEINWWRTSSSTAAATTTTTAVAAAITTTSATAKIWNDAGHLQFLITSETSIISTQAATTSVLTHRRFSLSGLCKWEGYLLFA